jgi:DNA-binding response OmpR family regulator
MNNRSLHHRSALIIDRFPDMQRLLTRSLHSIGFKEIDTAQQGGEALQRLQRTPYDLIICDYDLGRDYDGLHLFEEVREHSILPLSSAFILLSGEKRKDRIMGVLELAPDDYVTKPFNFNFFKERVLHAVEKRSSFKAIDQLIEQHKYDDAISLAQTMTTSHPEYQEDFLRLQGQLYLRNHDYHKAQNFYIEHSQHSWAKLGQAKVLFELNQLDESKLILEELLQKHPQFMEPYEWLTNIHRLQNNLEQAQIVLSLATKQSPISIKRQQQLSEVALVNRDWNAAAFAAKKAIDFTKHSSASHSPMLYITLAKAQMAQKEFSEAQESIELLKNIYIHQENNEFIVDTLEAEICLELGQTKKAHELFEKNMSYFKEHQRSIPPELRLEFAHLCYKYSKDDIAQKIVQDVIRNHHANPKILHQTQGIYHRLERSEHGKELIEKNVQSMMELNNLGVREAQSGQFESAIARFARAHEELPENTQIMLNLINASFALVHHRGWDEEAMQRTKVLLEQLRQKESKHPKLQHAEQVWKQLLKKQGRS